MLDVRALTKRYGGLLAVDNVSFTVNRGEVVGYEIYDVYQTVLGLLDQPCDNQALGVDRSVS